VNESGIIGELYDRQRSRRAEDQPDQASDQGEMNQRREELTSAAMAPTGIASAAEEVPD